MPPKKKQEEIDLSTLPPWVSRNIIVLCSGSQRRSASIIAQFKGYSNKMLRFIQEAEVLEHAKTKQLFVDVTTLTQKQKKELKPETPTEYTEEVRAKSLSSLIAQLNIANRVERKNKLDALNQPPADPKKAPKKEAKKEEKQPEPVVEKQYNKLFDSLYAIEGYPQSVGDIRELDKENEAINYVIVISPELVYPEEEEEQEVQEQQQEGEEGEEGQGDGQKQQPVVKKKQPKYPRQQLSEQDTLHNKQISDLVQIIREGKRVVPVSSEFRNCLIKEIKVEINVDKQQEELKNIPETIFQSVCEMSIERANYDDWIKVKIKKDFIKSEEQEAEEYINPSSFHTPLDLLMEVASSVQNIIKHPQRYKEESKERELEQIKGLFEDEIPVIPSFKSIEPITHQHFNENYWPAPRKIFKKEQKAIFQKLMLPGIDRTLMPEIPQKSYHRRRYDESTFVNFIHGQFDDFERISAITEFQKLMETIDPTKYCFNDRVYQQYHNKESIIDTFTKIFLHDPEIATKYDDRTDSLYVAVFYKNPDNRKNFRRWTGDWKTLPNFDNWVNYIKSNETNYKNSVFYNIDDIKLGRIVESTKETSPEDGSIIIQRVQEACESKKVDLKIIRNEEVFGIKEKGEGLEFWYTNFGHRVSVTKQEDRFQATVTLISGLILILNEKGHVYQKRGKESIKTLPSGFTIVYSDHKPPKILHPNGGLTSTSESFSNPIGLGVSYPNVLKEIPTLKRTNTTHSVTKREDETVIIEKGDMKWIKFYDGTLYQQSSDHLKIDKKGFAQGSLNNNDFRYTYEDVEINGVLGEGSYTFEIILKDGSRLTISNEGVLCFSPQSPHEHYKCDFEGRQLAYVGKEEIGFRVENVEGEKVDEREYKQREDTVEPRLFLIKNDNSAAEFFSEKQLSKYFKDKQSDPNTSIKRTQQPKSEIIQVISRIYPRPNVDPVSPDYPFDIDVLPVPAQRDIHQPQRISTLRILNKLHPLTPKDRDSFNETLKQQALWKAEKIKSDNEFGYCSRDSQNLEAQMSEIKRMIDKRRQAVKEFPYYQLRDKLLADLVQIVVLDERELIKNESGGYSLMNKKSLKRLQSDNLDENQSEAEKVSEIVKEPRSNFVVYEPCTNYFETPSGRLALSKMPPQIFNPPEEAPSMQVENQTERMLSSNAMSKVPQSAPVFPEASIQNASQSPFFQLNTSEKSDHNMSQASKKQIIIKPSVFTQQDLDEEKKAFEEQKKAYQKRALKRKQVDVYGKERVDKPIVPTLLRTQPVSEVNQKYILTESITEQKVKISSMKNRMMMNSSNLSELRKQGPHQAMMKSIDMSNTLEGIYEKRTQMVHANIKDSLSRDILILPAEANFGVVKQNSLYEIRLDVKNEDIMSQRIAIKRAKTNVVKAFLNQMGPIPLGISRKVVVQLRTTPEMKGRFTDEFEIVSKHQIYKIPVSAQIVSEQAFYSMSLKESKESLLKLGVSQLKLQSNPRGLKMNISQLPKI